MNTNADLHHYLPPSIKKEALTDAIKESLSVPNQFILVSGLTGSGKTTILYSINEHVGKQGKNVALVSDVEEWNHSGLKLIEPSNASYSDITTAMEHRKRILLKYAEFSKTIFLEFDPSTTVVLIDETSELNCRLAADLLRTGYTVVLTIHSNDPYDTFNRLEYFATQSDNSLLKDNFSVSLTQELLKSKHSPYMREAHISELTKMNNTEDPKAETVP